MAGYELHLKGEGLTEPGHMHGIATLWTDFVARLKKSGHSVTEEAVQLADDQPAETGAPPADADAPSEPPAGEPPVAPAE